MTSSTDSAVTVEDPSAIAGRVARNGALAVPAPELAAFVVTGGDRLTWLNGMLTCELSGRKPGDAIYGLQVALKGRIVSDVIVVVGEERVLLLVQRKATGVVTEMLDRHLMMEDALVQPAFDRFTTWLVHGPRAEDVLVAARKAGATGGLLDRTGLGGAVIVAEEPVAAVHDAIGAALAAVSGAFGDEAGWEALRVERAVPRFGVDFDEESYPQEAGLEKTAVSFSKGCYLGQEVVCMLELRGHVKRKLVHLVVEGSRSEVPARGAAGTEEGGAAVGEVRSAAWSPTQGKAVARAMVKWARAKEGGTVRGGGRSATIEPG